MKVSTDGSLYYLSIGSAAVFKVQYSPVSPTITTHPSNQTVIQGATATFTVSASGTAPLNYQWQKNMTNITGANSPSYTTPPTVAADNGAKFRCVVSNVSGNATSNEATLNVNVPPSITTHPSDKTVLSGQPVTFNVTAAGDPTLNYQWQRNTANISGANSPSLTISTTTFADNSAKFRCIVSNSFGTATSNEATLTVNAPPNIISQPSDQTVTQGQPATFNVSAGGTAPLNYQWQRNTVNISGANSTSYTISSAPSADSGAKFRCVVSNSFGSVNSNEATLTVQAPSPILQIEENTDRAIAFDSVTMLRDPYPLTNVLNFSSDNRTRVMLFAVNLDLLPGENNSVVTARAEDALMVLHSLTVEFVAKVPGFEELTQVIVVLPGDLPASSDWMKL